MSTPARGSSNGPDKTPLPTGAAGRAALAEQAEGCVEPQAKNAAPQSGTHRCERPRARCGRCRGEPERAVRTRALNDGTREMYYLAYLWRCSVCGHEWEDEDLRQTNAALGDWARTIASST
jgi:hypothetical protein